MNDVPLFIITGLSGAGKSKTSEVLRRIASNNIYVFDMDVLVVDGDFQKACCQWLEIARFNSKSKKATVLFGSVPSPYDFEKCQNYQAFKKVYSVLLHCEPEDRFIRLKERGDVWTEENIWLTIEEAENNYSKAMIEEIPIINTSKHSVLEVAVGLYYWTEKILRKNH